MQNINSVVITGNLTRDPELRHTENDTAVCELRVAVNGRRKKREQWVDKPNYFNVTAFGGRAESAAKYLSKGKPVAVQGRLDWQEWEAADGSGRRQGVKIIAENIQFLGGKPKDEEASATDSQDEDRQLAGVGAGSGDDDIPF